MKGMKKRLLAFALVVVLILTNALLVSANESTGSRITRFEYCTDEENHIVTFWADATLNDNEKLFAIFQDEDQEAYSVELVCSWDSDIYHEGSQELADGRYFVACLQVVNTDNNQVVETREEITDCTQRYFRFGPCPHTETEDVRMNECWNMGEMSYDLVTQCKECYQEISRELVTVSMVGFEIDGYGIKLTYNIFDMWDEINNKPIPTETESYMINTTLEVSDKTVGEQTEGLWEFTQNPTKQGATFEGFAKFYWEQDEDGMAYRVFQPKSANAPYYTLDEVMNETLTRDAVYAAKWSNIAIEDYYQEYNLDFSHYDEDASFTYAVLETDWETGEETWVEYDYGTYGRSACVGKCLNAEMGDWFKIVKDPTKEGAKFEGWAKFKVDYETNEHVFVPQSSEKQYYTTEEMMASEMPGYHVTFVPKWDNRSIDEYFPVSYAFYINANSGKFSINFGMNAEEEEEPYIIDTEKYFFGLTEGMSLGETFEDAGLKIGNFKKAGEIFEGWTVYSVEYIDNIGVLEGEEVPKSDANQLVVFDDTYTYEDGTTIDLYFILEGYQLVDKTMSTDKMMSSCMDSNYYAVANWKKSVALVEDKKVTESITKEGNSIIEQIQSGKGDEISESVISKETLEKVEAALSNNQVVETELVVYPVNVETLDKAEKADIEEEVAKELGEDAKVQYLDIQVLLKADDEILGTINELQEEIEITVAIPEDMKAVGGKYVVIRNHNGKIDVLPTTNNGDTITFKTGMFSTYALAYVEDTTSGADTGVAKPAPNTGDSSAVVTYMLLCVIAFAVIIVSKKRNSYNR